MKVKWKLLLAAGIVLLSLTIVAMRAYPRQTVWTGEYLEIYEGQSIVKEYETIPAKTNPDWVQTFQRWGAAAFVGGIALIGISVVKLKKLE
jgi:hypothetical protein